MLLDQGAESQHQLQMGILGRDREDFSLEAVVLPETPLQILQLR